METKICSKCGGDKLVVDFQKDKRRKGGRGNNCKTCINENYKIYRANNISKEKERSKKYRDLNKENRKDYSIANKERTKIYKENNKEKINIRRKTYTKERRLNDFLFKLKENIRQSIKQSFKIKKFRKKNKTIEIIGCSFEELKLHLESKFESWMSWGNHGLYNGEKNFGWDIDHIIPLDSALTEEDVIRLNNYTNLQPLCSYVNRYIKKNRCEAVFNNLASNN